MERSLSVIWDRLFAFEQVKLDPMPFSEADFHSKRMMINIWINDIINPASFGRI